MTTSVEMLHTWDTVYSADSVEWCPIVPHQNVFVCGTYQLAQEPIAPTDLSPNSGTTKSECEQSDKPAKRLGRLYLFSVSAAEGLLLKQTLDLPAILDLKWCHAKVCNEILLALANAEGEVAVYEMNDHLLTLKVKFNVGEEDSGTLALSLDWSTGRDASELSIVVSDSKGIVSVLKVSAGSFDRTSTWQAHSFEAWIAAFDYWIPSVVYTGGDDTKFHVYDTRLDTNRPVSTSSVHEAGVTSLHSNAGWEHTLVSGSYDENLRLWDTRSMRRPVHTTSLGGGVWRLKWNPRDWNQLLAACMHGGFQVVSCRSGFPPSILTSYKEHESLAYGSDWCHLSKDEVVDILPLHCKPQVKADCSSVIGTCSFYDHKLCVSAITFS